MGGGGQSGYEWRSDAFLKNIFFVGGGGGVGLGCQDGCDRRREIFCENSKKNFCENSKIFFFFFGGRGEGWAGGSNHGLGGVGLGGQDGCDRRREIFCENSKIIFFLGGEGGGLGRGGPIMGWGGGWDSKVCGMWVMWGMRDVNKE